MKTTLRIILAICSAVSFGLPFTVPALAQDNQAPCAAPPETALSVTATDILARLSAGQAIDLEDTKVEGDLNLTLLWKDGAPLTISITVPLKMAGAHLTGSFIAADPDREITVSFEEPVDFRSAHFDGRLDLSSAQFKQAANFLQTCFGSLADFTQTTFHAGASFDRAEFAGEAFFWDAQFGGGADFLETHFAQLANFQRARFDQTVTALFLKARFDGPTWFNETRFPASVIFHQVYFTGTVYFDGLISQETASFREAVFRRAVPKDIVSFRSASLAVLDLNGAQFADQELDLSGADYQTLLALNFNPAVLAKPSEPDVHLAILRQLESNFRAQNQLDTTNEIIYWRSRAERETKTWPAQVFETVFLDWPFGYGVRPLHAIGLSIIMILLFAVFYFPADTIRTAPVSPPKPRERKLALRLSEIPIAREDEFPERVRPQRSPRRSYPRLARAWQAIAFSWSVFTKIGWGERVAVRRTTIVVIEWVLGLIMIAGLFFSLANTIPLLNALLKSIL